MKEHERPYFAGIGDSLSARIDHEGNVVFEIYYSSWTEDLEFDKKLSLEEVTELHAWLGEYLKASKK